MKTLFLVPRNKSHILIVVTFFF